MVSQDELKIVAQVLLTTMCNAGYLDDWDEIIMEHYCEEGYEAAIEFAQEVETSAKFINKFVEIECSISTNFVEQAQEYIKCNKVDEQQMSDSSNYIEHIWQSARKRWLES